MQFLPKWIVSFRSSDWLVSVIEDNVPLWLVEQRGVFRACARLLKILLVRSYSDVFSALPRAVGFQLGDRHLFLIIFEEVWKSIPGLSSFLTLWILMVFAGSSNEDTLWIKVRTKRKKRPKTWSLRFDLLKINMCTWDNNPWKLVIRC